MVEPPTPILIRTVGRLLGWRLGLDHVDPRGTVVLTSAGGSFTHFPRGATPTLPTIFTHRDVGNTECPGAAAYAEMDRLRDMVHRILRTMFARGLFDRPADAGCLGALRRAPVIEGLTEPLAGLSEENWNRAVDRLRAARLLLPVDKAAPESLDAHPLVREWFGDRLRQSSAEHLRAPSPRGEPRGELAEGAERPEEQGAIPGDGAEDLSAEAAELAEMTGEGLWFGKVGEPAEEP